ncbi:D-alanyl-D-alanine carboxypeptidase [Synechocystis sp. PCC 7509]|uniref:D-alanyl-D-alanine carboxypeptidase n=1 Tax=Synechocystis sp. PCC 7509 TaxID=927677 RepID=UPI0002AC595F|nr:D-alanyl-D-alanine carboxypeptidase [Synechocystis sp. PCC 7509]
MLQLFGSGLVSLWLDKAGVKVATVDPLEVLLWQSSPSLVLAPDRSPVASITVQQYLKSLQTLGVEANQGVWIQSGPVLLANHQGTVPIPAASLTKIATSIAALSTWGANYQFDTTVSTNGTISKGVLQGDLIVQGNGDPLFVWEEAIALGNTLQSMGINRVQGNLIITGTFAMNYNFNPVASGELLKQAFNAANWSNTVENQYLTLAPGTIRPQIVISGTVQQSQIVNPKQILLVRHRSLLLSQILKEMNVYSNNEMSEMLAYLLGGAQVVQQKAATAANVPLAEIQLVNGSGLGVENRISPRAACAMLMSIQKRLSPYQLTVADLFPVSGRDRRGTLLTRQIPLNTVIKTGTLNDVSALAGVMPTRDRGLVWFAIINRGSAIERFRNEQDRLLQNLLKQLQVAPVVPAALTPRLQDSNSQPLGEARRNEIMYKG